MIPTIDDPEYALAYQRSCPRCKKGPNTWEVALLKEYNRKDLPRPQSICIDHTPEGRMYDTLSIEYKCNYCNKWFTIIYQVKEISY